MEELIQFLADNNSFWRFMHIAGAIIALGSVMFADLMLVWLKLKPNEAPVMAKISPIISLQVWLGFTLLSISGLFMLLYMQGIENSVLFQIKMLLVLVVFLNGIFLNVWINPGFEKLAPSWSSELNKGKIKRFTAIAGISTAISFLSWWAIVVIMLIFH